MLLKLVRKEFLGNATIGDLWVDGRWVCYTLEDVDRYLEDDGVKVLGETAIPRGFYGVIIDYSNRFKREMPHILDVPGFLGVRIHYGNSDVDTEGCVLVGNSHAVGKDWIGDSRAAFNVVFELLNHAYDRGEKIVLEVA